MISLLSLKQFFNDLRRQKLRTLMTTFGIFWGTCAIVLLFAFGKGITEAQLKSQKGLGENIAIYWPGITSKEFRGLPKGRRIRFTEDDVALIKARSQTISRISPEYSRWRVTMKRGKNTFNQQMIGIWPEFGEMRNIIPDVGSRFINELDMAQNRRVIFIGDRLKTDLFGSDPAVGETILVEGVPFTVIGVMKKKEQDSSYSGRDNRKGFIPSTTFKVMYSSRRLNDFVVQCKPELSMKQTEREIYEILGARYKFDPTDSEALSVWDTTEGFAFLKAFFTAFSTFLVGIGVATLITGGIGVTNIMNVVLEERTKEIGIKMALGARKSVILSQFVMETLLITAVGGLSGFLFAYLIVSVFPLLELGEFIGTPTVDTDIGLLAVLLVGLVGFVAGIFPARRAANLQPVQALKLF
ncbi:MAG: ABC transporter permease [candidate division Zixibacteria bacterium]|nr:ABC transporter permease [candidate division Zixibacteria bacterium]MDH3936147.1 ABC transporter permease [candidate division Zixibacteria bacterium]